MGTDRKMTPEAARALRSRATRFLVISATAILGAKGVQAGLESWLDVHLANVPTWLAGVVPTGGAIVSAIVSFVGSLRGDPTDTYLVDPAENGPCGVEWVNPRASTAPSPPVDNPAGTWIAPGPAPWPPDPPPFTTAPRLPDVTAPRGDGSELYVASLDPPDGDPPVPTGPVPIPVDEGDGGKGHLLPPGGF